MDVLGSPSLIVHTVSVAVKTTSEDGFRSELRSCVKVEVVVLGSPSLIVCAVSVGVKQQLEKKNLGKVIMCRHPSTPQTYVIPATRAGHAAKGVTGDRHSEHITLHVKLFPSSFRVLYVHRNH